MTDARTIHHQTLIIGGGSAGISMAARLRRAKVNDVAVLAPSDTHYYQPSWTLVGGGRAPLEGTGCPEASVMPQAVAWIKDRAEQIDPDASTVTTASGTGISYDHLVVCPGIQLDWAKVSGMEEAIGTPAVTSNYTYELAPKTWERVRAMTSGTAVFTMPAGPMKCAGAPQKIAYLAGGLLAPTGCTQKHSSCTGAAHPGHVRGQRVRRCTGRSRRSLWHRSP